VVITDPREIRDPLSDALTEVAHRVERLEEKVKNAEREGDSMSRS
jgi:uncharacterized protein Yka (UPF0111/DUF47 family)